MKSFFIIFVSLFIWRESSGQDKIPASLYQEAINSYRGPIHIYYMDSAMLPHRNLSYYSRKRKIQGHYDLKGNEPRSLKFTKRQIKELNTSIKNLKPQQWPDDMFKISTRLTQDSLLTFTKYLSNFDSNRSYKYYYYFSPIAFTSDSTIAIFRMAEMITPSAGYDFLIIYIKKDGIWKRKLIKHIGSW